VWDAFWRAAITCLHPRVLLWSLLPLAVAASAVGLAGWAYWEAALDAVRSTLDAWTMGDAVFRWLHSVGAPEMRALIAPMVVVALSVPAVLVLSLLLVAALATPAVVRLVVGQRFAGLRALRGASGLQALLWSLACTVAALLGLVLSIPLWLVPPLVMLLPPLIWGWLTCHVLAFDVLAHHASAAERRAILRGRRWTLLAMGVMCGYLGALPSLLWTAGTMALVLAPFVALLATWMYTVIFVFAACWFAHFCLAELQRLRDSLPAAGDIEPVGGPGAAPEALLPPRTEPPLEPSP
jgi:hypothetical protein